MLGTNEYASFHALYFSDKTQNSDCVEQTSATIEDTLNPRLGADTKELKPVNEL